MYNDNYNVEAPTCAREPLSGMKQVACRLLDEAKANRETACGLMVDMFGGDMPKFEDGDVRCLQDVLLQCEQILCQTRETLIVMQQRMDGVS